MPTLDPTYDPQLTSPADAAPDGDQWLHEIKYDGYRIGCFIDDGKVRLITRNGQNYTAALPEIVAAAKTLGVRQAVLDGEVVVLRPDGRASFQALQHALSGAAPRSGLVYVVFDMLHQDGRSLVAQPLEGRKAQLQQLLHGATTGRIKFAEHVVGNGPAFFAQAERLGLEGIVSKRRNAPYTAGRRGGWLKIKCPQRQSFVIGGYTDRAGTSGSIGSLLIGHYDGKRLAFAGRVGTGFSTRVAQQLHAQLSTMERPSSPFSPAPEGEMAKGAYYVSPTLVCDVSFTEWTGDDRVRHPSFLGLLPVVKPKSVTRQRSS
jgi:bifunctional non-homologous end joining protein LigD